MLNLYKTAAAYLLISGCSAHIPTPYQADRSPEDRDSYNGVIGAAQWQKDQSYLAGKELADKCEQLKTRIVQAHLTENTRLAEKLGKESKGICVGQ
ncbi:hypothetical protein [Rheinheimera sp. WS51]|uniref:hypothetical protein n=1 Tax=Rheinheimera sp. WS51 TaxID=3425886 RepID=UPI003D911A63